MTYHTLSIDTDIGRIRMTLGSINDLGLQREVESRVAVRLAEQFAAVLLFDYIKKNQIIGISYMIHVVYIVIAYH